MLDQETRSGIARDILAVFETRKPLGLLTKTHPGITVEDSYRIQEMCIAQRLSEGRSIRGYKVGLTSKAMQELTGSTEPDFSAMTDDLYLPEDTPLQMSDFILPMIEIEIAFVMKDALKGPGILPVDVIRATDFVLPAIEIVDFRVGPGPGMTVADTIADFAACGAAVLGANPRRLDQIDIRRIHGELIQNGEVKEAGVSSAVLGNPVTSVAWLANKLGEFGVAFEPGQVILTGSFVRTVPVQPGDEIIARFDNGLGDVIASFV
ncbi:2-keto-4-pentenoate hydratase [Pyruvatibacter sp. HU-CL02332]|uniref:2-keto-4-pentenoate hydratase n=1 Tax=Pyruvatibacter sp. HU-CL02332 TaxID=3127650 RepID=UPI00310C050C